MTKDNFFINYQTEYTKATDDDNSFKPLIIDKTFTKEEIVKFKEEWNAINIHGECIIPEEEYPEFDHCLHEDTRSQNGEDYCHDCGKILEDE